MDSHKIMKVERLCKSPIEVLQQSIDTLMFESNINQTHAMSKAQ